MKAAMLIFFLILHMAQGEWLGALQANHYPRLTRVASNMVGRPVTIQALDHSAGGATGNFTTDTVGVWKGGLKDLTKFPRILNEAALFAYAHEIGHLVTIAADPSLKGTPNQTGGLDVSLELHQKRERLATQWALQNVYKISLLLGADQRKAKDAVRRVKEYSRSING